MQWQILLVLFGTPTRITLVHEVLATLRAGLLTGELSAPIRMPRPVAARAWWPGHAVTEPTRRTEPAMSRSVQAERGR
jgi:hypothetical protein